MRAESLSAPAIFISHAANDPDWPSAEIEAIANELIAAGAVVHLDLWAERDRHRKLALNEWWAWMDWSLGSSHRVLCLISHRYAELANEPDPRKPEGRGVAHEMDLIHECLYLLKHQNVDGRFVASGPAGAPMPRRLARDVACYRVPAERSRLIADLTRPVETVESESAEEDPSALLHRRLRRAIEEECLDALYVPLSGQQIADRKVRLRLPQSTLRRLHLEGSAPREQVATEHSDLLEVVQPGTRALLLGEPGAGKTFALLKVMESDLGAGRTPVWVKLNHWLDGKMSFEAFVESEVPELGAEWQQALLPGRGRLLLDGLNELPAEHAAEQAAQISKWLGERPSCPVLIACRDDELPPYVFAYLRERLTIRPLRAQQMLAFVRHYVVEADIANEAAAMALFWQIVGGSAFQDAWSKRPASAEDTWLDALVHGTRRLPWLNDSDEAALAIARSDPARPYAMATNPYMLATLLWIWSYDDARHLLEGIPRQRVDVFDRFTRARLSDELEKRHLALDTSSIQDVLSDLAERLQQVAERTQRAREAGALAVSVEEIEPERQVAIDVALGARLLRREGHWLRFRHQLLQEFYVARYLRNLLSKGSNVLIGRLWGAEPPLWRRSGWLQPFLLLAEYQHEELPGLLKLLAGIQPEIAGAVWQQARKQVPALLTDVLACEIAQQLTAQMLPEHPSPEFPQREAIFGRGLGLMYEPRGRPLDRREGAWGWYDKESASAELSIDWMHIPAGPFEYMGSPARIERSYMISRYPVTRSQFQAFVDDSAGWRDPRWWRGAPRGESTKSWEPRWPYSNHPATNVSWWAARAFCRWLSALTNRRIELPSAKFWERAVGGVRGGTEAATRFSEDWVGGRAWGRGALEGTLVVGLFVESNGEEEGRTLAATVWEWCRGRIDTPWHERPLSADRIARGEFWLNPIENYHAVFRNRLPPSFRDDFLSFRVIQL